MCDNKKTLSIGDRVFITDQKHPWIANFGSVVSGIETYGLGWTGYRVKLDGNCGETFVRPDQVMGPGKVTSISLSCKRKTRNRDSSI